MYQSFANSRLSEPVGTFTHSFIPWLVLSFKVNKLPTKDSKLTKPSNHRLYSLPFENLPSTINKGDALSVYKEKKNISKFFKGMLMS